MTYSIRIKQQKRSIYILLLAVSILTGCSSGYQAEDQQTLEIQPVNAAIITLLPESTEIEQSYPANLEGKVNVEIRPQISGYIEKIHIDEGAFVKAGQPLFQINASVYREQKNTALASLDVAKSQLATAQLDLDKYEILRDKKVVADFQYERAKTAYETAKAAVGQQQALVASSEINMGFTTVKAPVSGYVGRIPKRLGALVAPADAEALTTLSQVDVVYAYFSLPENEILKINATRTGTSLIQKLQTFENIHFQLSDGNLYTHPGKIDMMDGQFDKGTGSVTVRASFPNPEGLLRSGNTGRVVLRSELNDIYKIPVLSTYEMQDKIFVGLLNDEQKMERVQLKDYHKSGDYYILSSGFNKGDRIIANELGNIPEHATIAPTNTK